jgi:hypothetical protein
MDTTEKTLSVFCAEVNNYFNRHEKIVGDFEVKDGQISGLDLVLKSGQFFRIKNSTFNDGVHRYPAEDLIDETFKGQIWPMAVPEAVMDLVDSIQAWRTKYEAADSIAMSPFTSESYSKYSYTKSAGGSTDGTGDKTTWQGAFANQLSQYRRARNIE